MPITGATVAYLTKRLVVGIGVGIAFAISSRVWMIGLHADPHAFHLFLISLLLLLLVVWADRHKAGAATQDRLLIGAAALFGVSIANHGLTLLLAPGVGLYVLFVYPGILRRLRLVAACVGALVLTTVVLYAYLPIRSAMNPPMDYANPQTWDNFWYVVLGQQFTGTFHTRPGVTQSIQLVARETWQQLGVLLPLAFLGLVVGFFRRTALMIMLLLWFALTWYFDLGYENADIGRYYLVPLMCVAVLGGLGAGAILEGAKIVVQRIAPARRQWARAAFAVGMAVVLIVPAIASVPGRFKAIDEFDRLRLAPVAHLAGDGTATGLSDRQLVELLNSLVVRAVRRGMAAGRDDHRRPHDPRPEPWRCRERCSQLRGQASCIPDPAAQRPAAFRAAVRPEAAARGGWSASAPGNRTERIGRDHWPGKDMNAAVTEATTSPQAEPDEATRARVAALSFFFPAHNEAENIEALVAEALAAAAQAGRRVRDHRRRRRQQGRDA